MASRNQSITEIRREQAFPILEPAEIERVRRFGTLRSYKPEEILSQAGKVSEGLTVILSGKVDVARHVLSGKGALIVTHFTGSFLGELAQLAGRPALVLVLQAQKHAGRCPDVLGAGAREHQPDRIAFVRHRRRPAVAGEPHLADLRLREEFEIERDLRAKPGGDGK